MSLGTPGRNQQYANYLTGLGVGVILGSVSAATDKFPTPLVVFGVVFIIVGFIIYFWANRKRER